MKGTIKKIQTAGGIRWDVRIGHNYRDYSERVGTKNEAQTRLDALRLQLGVGGYPLDVATVADVYSALEELPEGMTLTGAARLAAAQDTPRPEDSSLGDLAEAYLMAKGAAGMARHSLKNLASIVRRCAVALDGATVRDVTGQQLAMWVDSLQLTPGTRQNFKRDLGGWFRWAVAQGHREDDPSRAIVTIKAAKKLPEILSPAQVGALLAAAVAELADTRAKVDAYNANPNRRSLRKHAGASYVEGSGLVPYLALAAFAGVRPMELSRLDASHIAETEIHVPPELAKTKDARYIPIRANLRAWLDAYPPAPDRLVPCAESAFGRHLRKIRARAKLDAWPHDVLRHSFGSYYLAATNDLNETLAAMGHSAPAMLFQHYRRLVTKADAEQYFQIVPDSSRNIAE